jgi:hypothetical protein
MANDANNQQAPALPPTSLDEVIRNTWKPVPNPANGTRQQGTGGDAGALEKRLHPPQPPPRPPVRVRKGS